MHSMPDGLPKHQLSFADCLVWLEGNTGSINGVRKEET
jgi:hypothetical protein